MIERDKCGDWTEQALCRGLNPSIFYGESLSEVRQAAAICNGVPARHRRAGVPGCPVKDECLEWALANDERGVWAGTSERERRYILHLRRVEVRERQTA
jgi:WhiB family redox-sensing transcriptional regulator